jgi:hypothetical protein
LAVDAFSAGAGAAAGAEVAAGADVADSPVAALVFLLLLELLEDEAAEVEVAVAGAAPSVPPESALAFLLLFFADEVPAFSVEPAELADVSAAVVDLDFFDLLEAAEELVSVGAEVSDDDFADVLFFDLLELDEALESAVLSPDAVD